MLHKEIMYDAARALGASKAPAALPLLVEYLNSSQPEKRSAGAAGLAEMDIAARPAVPKLVKLIAEDEVASVRADAAYALGKVGPAEVVIPVLFERLERDQNEMVRGTSMLALGNFPGQAETLAPRIQQIASQEKSEKVRSIAGLALRRLREPQL